MLICYVIYCGIFRFKILINVELMFVIELCRKNIVDYSIILRKIDFKKLGIGGI